MNRQDSKFIQRGWTAEWWDLLTKGERQKKLAELSDREVDEFFHDWRVWARDNQLAPDWDWDTWLMLAGRGFGKTRSAVEFIIDKVESSNYPLRIAIVGQGADDVRNVMVEGQSGFIESSPPWNKPTFYPSKGGGQLHWRNGCVAFIYSIADTEALRGPQFHYGWCDEPMAAPRVQRERAIDNLEFCLRLGEHPQLLITTTPKPDPWLRDYERKSKDPEEKIAITRGTTHDNARNLAPNYLRKIERKYGGTRKGRQEIEGKILGDEENALWTEDLLEACRLKDEHPLDVRERCIKVVVGVDPNTKSSSDQPAAKKQKIAHAAGIVVVGSLPGRKRVVLADRSIGGGPEKWGKAVVAAAEEFDADEVYCESNQGGEMVRIVVRGAMDELDFSVPVFLKHNQRSKAGRAEPVAQRYEQGDIQHVGDPKALEDLEMQMVYLHEGEDPTGEDFDRVDALVMGMTRLGLKKKAASAKNGRGAGIRTMGEMTNGASDQGGFDSY
jgi:phage terminase large subunit-like protein